MTPFFLLAVAFLLLWVNTRTTTKPVQKWLTWWGGWLLVVAAGVAFWTGWTP